MIIARFGENFLGKCAQPLNKTFVTLEHRHVPGRLQLDEHAPRYNDGHETTGLRHDQTVKVASAHKRRCRYAVENLSGVVLEHGEGLARLYTWPRERIVAHGQVQLSACLSAGKAGQHPDQM